MGSGSSSGSWYVDWNTEDVPVIVPPGATCCRLIASAQLRASFNPSGENHTSFCDSIAGNDDSNAVVSSLAGLLCIKSSSPPSKSPSSTVADVEMWSLADANWSASSPRAARSRARKSSGSAAAPVPSLVAVISFGSRESVRYWLHIVIWHGGPIWGSWEYLLSRTPQAKGNGQPC